MSATISYKHLSQLVNQLINVVDQTDVTSEVCRSEVEREHRRSRLSRELRTVLSRLRETQREIEQYLAPVAPIRRVEQTSLDDEWEKLIDAVKIQLLENTTDVPSGWFGFKIRLQPEVPHKVAERNDAHRLLRTLDTVWEDCEDLPRQEAVIREVVRLMNKTFNDRWSDCCFRRQDSGVYAWSRHPLPSVNQS